MPRVPTSHREGADNSRFSASRIWVEGGYTKSAESRVSESSESAAESTSLAWDHLYSSSSPGLRRWLTTGQPVALHHDMLMVAVPNIFTRNQLENRFRADIERLLSEYFGRNIQLAVIVDESLETRRRVARRRDLRTATNLDMADLPPMPIPALIIMTTLARITAMTACSQQTFGTRVCPARNSTASTHFRGDSGPPSASARPEASRGEPATAIATFMEMDRDMAHVARTSPGSIPSTPSRPSSSAARTASPMLLLSPSPKTRASRTTR